MSVVRCSECNAQIDTDLEAECVVDDPRHSVRPHLDLIMCAKCREHFASDLERAGSGGMK